MDPYYRSGDINPPRNIEVRYFPNPRHSGPTQTGRTANYQVPYIQKPVQNRTDHRPTFSHSSATKNQVSPKPPTVQSNTASQSTSFRPSMTHQGSAASNQVSPKPVQSNTGNGSTLVRPSMTPKSSVANNGVSPKPPTVQSSAISQSTSFRTSMTSQGSAAINQVSTKPPMAQGNAASQSTSFKPASTHQGSAAINQVSTKPPMAQGNAASQSTSFKPASTHQGSAAINQVSTKPPMAQGNAASQSTSFKPASTHQGSAAINQVSTKPPIAQGNAASQSTSFKPASTHQGSAAINQVSTKPPMAQGNAASQSTSFKPASTHQGSAVNNQVSTKPPMAQGNAASQSTTFKPASTHQGSAVNNQVSTKPPMVQGNAASQSTSFKPALTHQGSAANNQVSTKPPMAQGNAARQSTSFKPASMHQGSPNNNPVLPKPAQNNAVNESTPVRPSMTPQNSAANSSFTGNNIFTTAAISVSEPSELNVTKNVDRRSSADVEPRLSFPIRDMDDSPSANNTRTANVFGPSSSRGGYSVTEQSEMPEDWQDSIVEEQMSVEQSGEGVSTDDNSPQDRPMPEPTPETNLYSSVCRVLNCSECEGWMSQGQVKLCACRIICVDCAAPLPKCEHCAQTFLDDFRLVNFYLRVAAQIDRPCKYRRGGCTYVVKPGDEHEAVCDYEPVLCVRCKEYVSKAFMEDHYDNVHYLGTKNTDVKYEDFFYMENTGSRTIKCVTSQGLDVRIILFNIESVDEYIRFTVMYPNTELNVSIKLDFEKDGYTYTRSTSKTLNDPVSYIEVDKKQFIDWTTGQSKLGIEVSARKKRQLQTQRNVKVAKKARTALKGRCNGMRSLQPAHKQKKKKEPLIKSAKVIPQKES